MKIALELQKLVLRTLEIEISFEKIQVSVMGIIMSSSATEK